MLLTNIIYFIFYFCNFPFPPKFYFGPLPFSHLLTGSEHAQNLLELSRTSYNPYKVQVFSSPSDLMKSTVVNKSLSTNTTRVLFQRKTTSLFHSNVNPLLKLKVD